MKINYVVIIIFIIFYISACSTDNYIKPSPLPIKIYPNQSNLTINEDDDYKEVIFSTKDSSKQIISWYDDRIPNDWQRFYYNEYRYQALNSQLKCYTQSFFVESTNPINGEITVTLTYQLEKHSC